MASMFKYVNYARPTICKNCTSFIKNQHPYNQDWCIYYDIPVNKENNIHCSEYREITDDEENIPIELIEKGEKIRETELKQYKGNK